MTYFLVVLILSIHVISIWLKTGGDINNLLPDDVWKFVHKPIPTDRMWAKEMSIAEHNNCEIALMWLITWYHTENSLFYRKVEILECEILMF